MWTSTPLVALCVSLALAQAPNTVATLYPSLRTQALNGTYFVVPVADATLEELIKPYSLVPLSASDAALFPHGYPAGTHPLLVYSGYSNDIRQTITGLPAYIPALLTSEVIIPFVDRLGDGKTAFAKTVAGYLGGPDGQTLQGVVPALVGTITSTFGYPLFVATFDPDTAAWTPLGGQEAFQNTKEVVVPNTVSGPGIYPSAIDLLFDATDDPQVSQFLIKSVLNQPAILPSGQCQYNAYRFNESFADPISRSGNVTLYSPALPQQLTGETGFGGSKVYSGPGVGGLSATAEQIGFNATDCPTAASMSVVV